LPRSSPVRLSLIIRQSENWANNVLGNLNKQTETLPEYAPVYEAFLKGYDAVKKGDKGKAVEAIIAMVNSENPPLHFPVGLLATYGIRDALSKRIDEVVEWEKLSLIAD
jgi:hypothetical protein